MNLLQTNLFRASIPDLNNLELTLSTGIIPSVSTQAVISRIRGDQGFVPSENITYENLSLEFMVTENMSNYNEILKWLLDNKKSNKPIVKDIIMSIYNSLNNVIKQVRYVRAFPLTLGEINFDIKKTATEYATCPTTFAYDYFELLDV